MTAAVIVSHALPAQLTAISAELIARRDELAAKADMAAVTDVPSLLAAEGLFKDLDAFTKQVKEDRLVLTRQIDDIADQIRAAEKSAIDPLAARRDRLMKLTAAFRDKLAAEERERQRLAREKAEREAAELRRQQEEERKAELARYEAEKAAAQKAADEEAALFGGQAVDVAVPAPPPAASAPVVPVIDATPVVPVLPKAPVQKSTRHRLNIFDRAALIAAACKDNGKLYGRQVLIVDEAAVDALCKAAVDVPGAKREAFTQLGASGRS
jgi:hypothetical protein